MSQSSKQTPVSTSAESARAPSAPPEPGVNFNKIVKIVLVHPMRWCRRPRAETGDTRGELNFQQDEVLKHATVWEGRDGIELSGMQNYYNVLIPWSNIVSVWKEPVV